MRRTPDHDISDYYTPTSTSSEEWAIKCLSDSPADTRLTLNEDNTLVGANLKNSQVVRIVTADEAVGVVDDGYIDTIGVGVLPTQTIDDAPHIDIDSPYTKKHIPIDVAPTEYATDISENFTSPEWIHTADIRFQHIRQTMDRGEIYTLDVMIMTLRDGCVIPPEQDDVEAIEAITGYDRDVIQDRINALLSGKREQYRNAINEVRDETYRESFTDQTR